MLTFVTTLRPGEGMGAGDVSVDVQMLVYAFGMPFFAALTLAAREPKWWRTLALGYRRDRAVRRVGRAGRLPQGDRHRGAARDRVADRLRVDGSAS